MGSALSTTTAVAIESMHRLLHSYPLFNASTVFSTVMVPATGYYKTFLNDEIPNPFVKSALQKNQSLPTIDYPPPMRNPIHEVQMMMQKGSIEQLHSPLSTANSFVQADYIDGDTVSKF